MNKITTVIQNGQRVLKRNSPAILTAIGIAGVVGTAVLAVRATPEAVRRIQDAESEQLDPITNLEKVKLTWTLYIPATVSGIVTVASVLGAHTISTRRNAALLSLVTLTETTLREYQAKVVEQIGKNQEGKIRDAVIQDRIDSNPPVTSEVIITGDGNTLCWDSFSGRYFQGNIESIRKAQNDINSQTIHQQYASQNDFYRLLNLDPTAFGDEYGWRNDNMLDIRFSSHLTPEGKPALAIVYHIEPVKWYYKEG